MPEVTISGLIEGGKATSGPPFGPAMGPLGVNVSAIINEINEKTKAFEGLKIPVKVIIDPLSKSHRIEIGSPPTSAIILRELGIPKGAKTKDEIAGNITLEQAKKVAESKKLQLYGNTIEDRVKQVLGTCKSMNITCEGVSAVEIIGRLKSGDIKL